FVRRRPSRGRADACDLGRGYPRHHACGEVKLLTRIGCPLSGVKRTWPNGDISSAYGTKRTFGDVRFSNRPSGIKHFQAIQHSSVDVAHGLALLFGLGTRALPLWDSKTRWNNLLGDLAVNVTAGSSGHTNSPHPSSREEHHSTVGWIAGFLLFDLILCILMLGRPPWSTGSPCRQPRCGA